MDLSIPKDASDVSEDVPSKEDTSESFARRKKGSEAAALVTADPLANVKADFDRRKADFDRRKADFESLALTTDLSIPKDAPDASEDVPSEEDTSESFPNQENNSETTALVTADLHSASTAGAGADVESIQVTAKERKEARKMKGGSIKQGTAKERKEARKMKGGSIKDDVKKPAGKKDAPELPPGVESSEDIAALDNASAAAAATDQASASRRSPRPPSKQDYIASSTSSAKPGAAHVGGSESKKDRLELAPGVEPGEGTTHLHNASAADAAINQDLASRRCPRPQSQQNSLFADSSSSLKPGAVYVGGSESNHLEPHVVRGGGTESNPTELTLRTQEERDTEQRFEKTLPIAAVLPDDKAIAEAHIVVTAKVCGQPRWLIFPLLGVLVAAAIGASLGVGLSGGDPFLDRLNELKEVLRAESPFLEFGAAQTDAINWLAKEDPAFLDFEATPSRTILERYVIVTLYYSLNGPDWQEQLGFLSKESVCKWGVVNAAEMTIKGVACNEPDEFVVEPVVEINLSENQLTGNIPSELGLLITLEELDLSGNKLTGKIPSEIGSLTGLTFVDLSKCLCLSITKCILSTNFFNLDCIAPGMNDDLVGMVPTELKELTELQDLHLDGTSLNGSLSVLFCIDDFNITNFTADCAGRDEAEVECSCCTQCCGRIDDETYTCDRKIPFAKALSVLLAEADLDGMALSSPGTPQYQALDWLANEDPANLDFVLVPPDMLLERFIMALLYFSTAGETWNDSSGFLNASSVCSWHGAIVCDPTVVESHPMVVKIYLSENNLHGQLPTELSLLSKLEDFRLCKFTTVSSSEFDTTKLLGSLSYKLSRLRFCSPK
jgi:hypothetical protein